MCKEEEQATFAASRSSTAGLGGRGELCLAEKGGKKRDVYGDGNEKGEEGDMLVVL